MKNAQSGLAPQGAAHADDSSMSPAGNTRLDVAVRFLSIPKRAQDACNALGIRTVRDAIACDGEQFASAPNCGRKSYNTFRRVVERFLDAADDRINFRQTEQFGQPLDSVVPKSPTLRALGRAGIRTIGHFLTTPMADHQMVRGVSAQGCETLLQEVLAATTQPLNAFLPDCVRDLPLSSLFLPDTLHRAFDDLDLQCIGDLLFNAPAALGAVGEAGASVVQHEMHRILQAGLSRHTDPLKDDGRAFRAFYERITSELDDGQREILARRIGLGGRNADSRWQLAACLGREEHEVASHEVAIIDSLHGTYSDMLGRFRNEIAAELTATDGLLTRANLTPGTLLHSAAQHDQGDNNLPMRLASVLFPEEYFHHETFLSSMQPAAFATFRSQLAKLCRRECLPRLVTSICAELSQLREEPVSEDLVTHVARFHLRRAVHIDPDSGEVLTTKASTLAERLQLLVEERDQPSRLADLLFAYRDRYRRVHLSALRAQLRADSRFVELGPDLFSLRDRHLDELELARVEADRICQVIRTVGGRHRVADLSEDSPYSARQIFLIADLLRHEPCIRDLGRNEFCPRFGDHSQVMAELLTALTRAAGEIPIDRFLDNQPPHRRRLVETLFLRNRSFVCPKRNHVDLITNYPYDSDRIRRLRIVVDQHLAEHGGYAREDGVLEVVNAAGLGGDFLSKHLLRDILQRHSRYEFLAGELIAQSDLGLTGWIQQLARETIRTAEQDALTMDEVLMERPELAEFGHCLRDLLCRDPLLQVVEGDRFQVA